MARAKRWGPGTDAAAEAFAGELVAQRDRLGITQAELARRMGVHKTYVSQLERCVQAPSDAFAAAADRALGAAGAVWGRWEAYETARRQAKNRYLGAPQRRNGRRRAPVCEQLRLVPIS